MEVIYDISYFNPQKKVILTQGTFDGVHFGHRRILSHVVSEAKRCDGVSVLLTFYPHPRLVLHPDDNDLKLLTTIEEKVSLVSSLGIDYLVIIPFTQDLSRLRAAEFVRDILVGQLRLSKLIIGYDHRFGRNREGGLQEMIHYSDTYNFELEEIPPQDIDDSIVSSTKIRKALLGGDVHLAKEYLGDFYSLTGTVEEGLQRGTTIGYPTANIRVSSGFKLIPKNGVYAVWVYIDKIKFSGMLNVGFNPTFVDKKWSMEVHIFDFNKNIYHHKIFVSFQARIRDEIKFENESALVDQLKQDENRIRQVLAI